MGAKKLCVDDTELGPTLIPLVLEGFVNRRLLVFSSTSFIFEFCPATFMSFIFIVRGDYRVLLQLN